MTFSASFLNASISPQESIKQATTLSKEARSKTFLHCLSDHGCIPLRAEQRTRERQILQLVRESLTDYSQENVRKSVENFLLNSLSFRPISMVEIKADKPKEAIFIASNNDQELYIYVFCSDNEKEEIPSPDFSKAYKTRDSHFIRQLAAADLMRSLHLSAAVPQEHLSAGFCKIDGSNYYLVAGPNLPGKNMSLLHADIFKYPKGSEERAKAIKVFKRALTNLAVTLGEMHSINATPQQMTPEILSAFQERIDSKLKTYQAAGGDQGDKIRAVLENQLAELAKGQVSLTYYHGCANLNKFFYDEQNDKLIMKEIYEAHPSMGLNGEPLGLFAGHDIVSPLENILFETLRLGEDDSVLADELCETFTQTYRKTVGVHYQPALFEMEKLLRRIERYSGCLNHGDDPFKKKCLKFCNELFSL